MEWCSTHQASVVAAEAVAAQARPPTCRTKAAIICRRSSALDTWDTGRSEVDYVALLQLVFSLLVPSLREEQQLKLRSHIS